MISAFQGPALHIGVGWLSAQWRGANTFATVLGLTVVTLVLCGFTGNMLTVTMPLFMMCFAALGARSGGLFQVVQLCSLTTTAVGSMIGQIGALDDGLIPNTKERVLH